METIEQSILEFLKKCPTPWHFTAYALEKLQSDPLCIIDNLEQIPKLQAGKKYFFHKNGMGVGILLPKKNITKCRIFTCHTDSPALKVKQQGLSIKEGMSVLGCEIYGSPIIASWIGIPLTITGKIWGKNRQGNNQEWLLSPHGISAFLPHVAIHLNRNVNEDGLFIHKQEGLFPIVSIDRKITSMKELFQIEELESLFFHDLYVLPQQLPTCMGDGLISPRLDNLSSSWALFESFLQMKPDFDSETGLLFFFCNHEEVGSETSEGAYSSCMRDIFDAMLEEKSAVERLQIQNRSLILSCDAAHATHPLAAEKHDPHHKLFPGKGIALKLNSNQRYSTSPKRLAELIAFFEQENICYQFFTARNDIPCGSTVGPIFSARFGIDAVDMGIPILGMHAGVELGSLRDSIDLMKAVIKISEVM